MQLWGESPHNWYLVFNNWCYPGVTLVSIYNYIFIAIHHFGIAFVKNRFTNGLLKLSTACFHMNSFNSWLAFVCIDINDKWACLKWKRAHCFSLLIEFKLFKTLESDFTHLLLLEENYLQIILFTPFSYSFFFFYL